MTTKLAFHFVAHPPPSISPTKAHNTSLRDNTIRFPHLFLFQCSGIFWLLHLYLHSLPDNSLFHKDDTLHNLLFPHSHLIPKKHSVNDCCKCILLILLDLGLFLLFLLPAWHSFRYHRSHVPSVFQ